MKGKNAVKLAIFAAAAVISAAAALRRYDGAWALNLTPILTAPLKNEVVLSDNDKRLSARKANVLFLLDTGSAMTFTPTGTMPEWGVNVNRQADAGQMLKQATYGHGGRDVVGNTTNTASKERYGREGLEAVDEENNMTPGNIDLANHKNNYYAPFNYPNNPLGANPAPYALVFKNSAWRQNGPPAGSFTKSDLVPNDSRMYKMKLVMWQVLSDTVLIENLRFGMATTFQELNGPSTNYVADFYKTSPFGVHQSIPQFPYGTGPSWATSLADYTSAGGGYYNSAVAYWGIDREYYDLSHADRRWKLLNRAYLRLPIAEYSDSHIAKFRLWLDGYEDITVNDAASPYYFRNPELIGDGKTYLSTAIYPGHSDLTRSTLMGTTDLMGRPGMVFSHRGAPTMASLYTNSEAAFSNGTALGNYFKAGSGEALGTILDFFSPPVNGIGGVSGNAHNVARAPANSFPLNDPCEKNWVVIFTAGDDSGDAGGYSSASAVEKLYEFTRDNNLTKLKKEGTGNANNEFEGIKLDDGVRTLVVGFVDPDSTAPNVVALREKLDAMARAGDPRSPDQEPARAFFANDTEGLINALRAVLARINNEIQPAPGPMTEASKMDDQVADARTFNLFKAGYRIVLYDQWMGTLTRYETVKSDDGSVKMTERWELDSALLAGRGDNDAVGTRKVVYWHNNALEDIGFTTSKTNSTEHKTASLTGLTSAFVAGMDKSNLRQPNAAPTVDPMAGKLHPSRALINWLYGWDFSYYENKYAKRRAMLSDFGHSGTALVGPPRVENSLPGYYNWANHDDRKNLKTRLYAQTNDGLLHVINPTGTGSNLEQYAIAPPPTLLPNRLTTLKTARLSDGATRWVDVSEYVSNTSEDIPISSVPAYLLDGPVQSKAFDIAGSGTSWGQYLISTLGRAGNGIYLMDVSLPDAPKFYWYRETIDNEDGSLSLLRMGAGENEPAVLNVAARDWNSIYTDPDSYPFYQLGFNSPKPGAGVAMFSDSKLKNIIALAGGMQRSLDLRDNGRMGAALYIIDPDASKHVSFTNNPKWVKVFNSASVHPGWRVGSALYGESPYMGMMVSEPVLCQSKIESSLVDPIFVTGKIFASDNRGSIFVLQMENTDGTRVLNEDGWSLKTAATLRGAADQPSDSYASPYGVIVTSKRGEADIYVAGGTANVGTRGNDPKTDSALITNKEQLIYCFILPDLNASGSGNTATRNDWSSLDGNDVNSKMDPAKKGWYNILESLPDSNYLPEYSSAQPAFFAGDVYFTTFLQEKINLDDADNKCADNAVRGKSRIYALNMGNGMGDRWEGGKYVEIDGAKVVGITNSVEGDGESLLVTFEIFDELKYEESMAEVQGNQEGVNKIDGLAGNMGGASIKNTRSRKLPLKSGDSLINYWLTR